MVDAAHHLNGKRFGLFAWPDACLAVGANHLSSRTMGIGRALLALVMIAPGVRGLVFGDFAGASAVADSYRGIGWKTIWP